MKVQQNSEQLIYLALFFDFGTTSLQGCSANRTDARTFCLTAVNMIGALSRQAAQVNGDDGGCP